MRNIHSIRVEVKNSISSEMCHKVAKLQKEYPDLWVCPEDKHTIYVESESITRLIYAEIILKGL